MSAEGSYCIINDRTYLYEETSKRLFKELGIDADMNLVRISQ